jgi:hypothetical protein
VWGSRYLQPREKQLNLLLSLSSTVVALTTFTLQSLQVKPTLIPPQFRDPKQSPHNAQTSPPHASPLFSSPFSIKHTSFQSPSSSLHHQRLTIPLTSQSAHLAPHQLAPAARTSRPLAHQLAIRSALKRLLSVRNPMQVPGSWVVNLRMPLACSSPLYRHKLLHPKQFSALCQK